MAQADINTVTLVGRLTRDAEQRQAGETTIHAMRLAFTSREKRGGEWQDRSNYIDLTLFGREGVGPYLVKGARIAVSGRLSWREWRDKEGNARQSHEVIVNDLELLGDGERKASSDLPGEWGTLPSEPVKGDDDSIPF